MKENFNTKSALFTECKNSIPSLRFAFEYGPVWRKSPLFRVFSNTKIMLKMSQNLKYFHSKWLLNMFGDVFHVSPGADHEKT